MSSRRRNRDRRERRRRDRTPSEEVKNDGTSVFIKNLSRRIADDELRSAFEEFGDISGIDVVKEPFSEYVPTQYRLRINLFSDCRGFAFVTYAENKAAEACIEKMNGAEFQDKTLVVEMAKRKKGRKSTPGRYLGRSKGGRREGGRRR